VNNPRNQAGAEWDTEFKCWVAPEVTEEIAGSKDWHKKYSKAKASWIVENLDNQLDHHQHMVYYQECDADKPPNETGIMTLREGRPNNAGATWNEVDGWIKEPIEPRHSVKQTPLDTSLKNIGYGERPRGRKKNKSGGKWNERSQCWMTIPHAGISTHSFLGDGDLGSKNGGNRKALERSRAIEKKKKKMMMMSSATREAARPTVARAQSPSDSARESLCSTARSVDRSYGGTPQKMLTRSTAALEAAVFAPLSSHYTNPNGNYSNANNGSATTISPGDLSAGLSTGLSTARQNNHHTLLRFIGGIKSDQHDTRKNLTKFISGAQKRPVSASAALQAHTTYAPVLHTNSHQLRT
jgi:hypothetical protein